MKLYDTVKEVLEQYPDTRDSDKKLMWLIWSRQLEKSTSESISHYDFLSKQVTTPESITRARRKVQQTHEHLRATKAVETARKRKEQTKGLFIFNRFRK